MNKNDTVITHWVKIAKKNFNDEKFSEWMDVTHAYGVFQHSQKQIPLTEDLYRAQAALLNALLTYHLDLSAAKYGEKDCRSYVDNKIETYLRHLDSLIAHSCTLEKTASLDELQKLVKCLLYTRVGDYLMGWLKFVLEDLMQAMSNHKLSSLLFKHINSNSSSKSSPLPDVSFIASDVSHRIAGGWQFMPLDMDKLLPLAWTSSLNHNHFFRRLIWILNQEEISEFDHYPFLNRTLAQQFSLYPESLDMPCCPENLSLMDLKVYLFRVSKVVSLSSKNSDVVYPWTISPKPTSQQANVWNSIVAMCSGLQLQLNQIIGLTNGLEQIRLQSAIPSDKVNLAQTMTYLESVANELIDVNCQKIYIELAERYANAVLSAMDAVQSNTRTSNLQTKPLFPSKTTSVVLDDELADLANVFLAKRLYNAKCYRAAEERLMEVSQRSNQMDIVCKLLASIYDKLAGNEQLNVKPKQEEVNGQRIPNLLRPSCSRKGSLSHGFLFSVMKITESENHESKREGYSSPKAKEVREEYVQELFQKNESREVEAVDLSSSNEPDSDLSFASALSDIQDQPNNVSASSGTMISNSQNGLQEMEELNKNILKCIKHNELLIKFINSQSGPAIDFSHLQGINHRAAQQSSCAQLLDEMKVKVLEDPRKKHQVCVAKFSKNNDVYELHVTDSANCALTKLYVLNAGFRFQIISKLTVRFINLVHEGNLQKPMF
uniref:Uncharacterized protein n=1 Tax=Ditylenchus dipsaci TaxID=166011 RepID=A0A915ECV7_9BILA